MTGDRTGFLTIVFIAILVASISVGPVTVFGVSDPIHGDKLIAEGVGSDRPDDRAVFVDGLSGKTLRIDDMQSLPLTETKTVENGNAVNLTTTPITDSQTGNGNEVTVVVTYDQAMTENVSHVTVTPDVNGDLTTSPSVENKRWSDSRTFKAAIQYTDNNEDIAGVRLEVDGARDLAGNPMNGTVSTTYAVETTNPSVESVEVIAPREIAVTFSEGVYSNENGSGQLTQSVFDYSDDNAAGVSGIDSVAHTEGSRKAVLTLDAAIQNSDLETDRITIPDSTVSDTVGNDLSAGSHTYADATPDDVKPLVESFSASEAGPGIDISFTADEKLSSADVTIDDVSVYGYGDLNEQSNADGSFTYTVTHTPRRDGTYTVSLVSIDDGTHRVTPLRTQTSTTVTVDTTGPSFGSLTSPRDPTNTTSPTITVAGVRDALNSVNETTLTVEIRETDGSSVETVSETATTGLSYRSNTVRLELSKTETSLRDGTTYNVTISADDDDESANSNSKAFAQAFTVDTTAPTVDRVFLSANPVRKTQTGDGNEVTVTVIFDEAMKTKTAAVTVRPDLNEELRASPIVENKRWSGARTFKADIQFTDTNESVSAVKLEINGATDVAGNAINGVSTTYGVETAQNQPDGKATEMMTLGVIVFGLFAYYLLLNSM